MDNIGSGQGYNKKIPGGVVEFDGVGYMPHIRILDKFMTALIQSL